MSRAEIIAHLEAAIDFPFHAKHKAIAIDVTVLREAARELRAGLVFHRTNEAPQHGGLARVVELPIAGAHTE